MGSLGAPHPPHLIAGSSEKGLSVFFSDLLLQNILSSVCVLWEWCLFSSPAE